MSTTHFGQLSVEAQLESVVDTLGEIFSESDLREGDKWREVFHLSSDAYCGVDLSSGAMLEEGAKPKAVRAEMLKYLDGLVAAAGDLKELGESAEKVATARRVLRAQTCKTN